MDNKCGLQSKMTETKLELIAKIRNASHALTVDMQEPLMPASCVKGLRHYQSEQ